MTELIDLPESPAITEVAPEPVAAGSPRRRRRRTPVGVLVAMAWLGLVVIAALVADLLPLTDPGVDAGVGARVRPFQTAAEPLGTDSFGRSMLSRLVFGARVSLVAGVGAVTVALIMGLLFGVTAGYFRGKWEGAVGLLVDTLLAIPSVVLLLALASTLQPSLTTIVIGLALVSFPYFTRVSRAATLQYGEAEFVLASRGLGARAQTTLTREILPNVLVSVGAYAGVICAVLILAESTLSFLGLGVPQPTPSWGNMIADGRSFLQQEPYLIFEPIIVLSMTILALNTTGEWLRRRSDVAARL
jgi:peptide/nickel transport system permease protein